MKSGETWQAVSEQKIFKDLYDFILHVHSPGARADNPRDKILIVTNKFYYFNHTL